MFETICMLILNNMRNYSLATCTLSCDAAMRHTRCKTLHLHENPFGEFTLVVCFRPLVCTCNVLVNVVVKCFSCSFPPCSTLCLVGSHLTPDSSPIKPKICVPFLLLTLFRQRFSMGGYQPVTRSSLSESECVVVFC